MPKSNKDWSQDREGAYAYVFLSHKWGNSNNSGKGKNGGYKAAQERKGRKPL